MNVRLTDHALRVRFSASDVDALRTRAAVRCTISLPAGLAMQVTAKCTDHEVPGITHSVEQHAVALHITVPARELERWRELRGKERSVQHQLAAPTPLLLTIEQDLHPKPERL